MDGEPLAHARSHTKPAATRLVAVLVAVALVAFVATTEFYSDTVHSIAYGSIGPPKTETFIAHAKDENEHARATPSE